MRRLSIAVAGILLVAFWSAYSLASITTATVNETGTSGAPVSAQACSGGTTKVITGSPFTSSYSLMPEGCDIRCSRGTSADGAPNTTNALDNFVATATVGFLFKSNTLVVNVNPDVTARVDCCGVAGACSVDTWHSF